MPLTKLTKYKSAVTILTEDVANSWYGGLFGSTEGASLDPLDPLIAGHVHDGVHLDGHAQKINLADHVTGQLDGGNIKPGTLPVSAFVSNCCALLIVTNDGRLVQDTDGNILLKDTP